MLGITPKTAIFPPTFEELEDMDIALIKKYYKAAMALNAEVETAPESSSAVYRKLLSDTVKYYTTRQWDLMNDCIEDKIEIINEKDSTCNDKLSKLEEMYRKKSRHTVDVMSVTVSENQFVANGEGKLESFPSLSVQLAVNLYKLIGFWRGMEFYYEYMSPRIKTKTDVGFEPGLVIKEQWASDLHVIGINGNIKPVFDWSSYSDGIRLGLGYFWVKGHIYNRDFTGYDWEGLRFDLKYFAGPPILSLPIEFVFGGSLYQSVNESLIFNSQIAGGKIINLGKTHIALTLGLRYNFWKTPY
jgi:hypothetical protein